MAYIPNSNSVVGFQSQPSSLLVGASIIGLTPVAPTPSSVMVVNTVSTLSVNQGTSPWVVNVPTSSYIAYQLAGSVLAVSGSFSSTNTSVTAYQGGAWSASITSGYLNVIGSVATVPATGTWITSVMNTNPSSLMVGASIFGTVPVTQTTSPWVVNVPTPSYISYQVAGSVMAVSGSFSAGNSSVTLLGGGTIYQEKNAVTASALGIPVLFKIDETNSVLSAVSPQSPFPIRGSVTALQGTNPWQVNLSSPSIIILTPAGSVQAVRTDNASVIAVLSNSSVAVLQGTNPWLIGNTSVQLVAGTVAIGSVAVLQGTNPWIVNVPTPSYISYQAAGSIMAVSGSFSSGNTSVQLLGSNAVIGSVTALQGTQPWLVNVQGSVALGVGNTSVTQSGAWNVNVNSILGTYTEKNAVTASAIGIPILFKIDETNSVLSAVSPQSPFPVKGSVTVLQGTNPWQVNLSSPSIIILTPAGSVQAVRTDNASVIAVLSNSSVAVLQGTNPWVVNVPTPSYLSIQPGGSVLNANISGSVAAAITNFTASVAANINVISASIVTNQGTNPWVIGSIVGTYAEDSASNTADKGIFSLNVRNDTMSSVTSADGDYGALSIGPVGEGIFANAPITKWISKVTSVMSGTSVQSFAGPGTSIFTYITGIYVTNEASVASRVTITQGLGAVPSSFLTVLIAPAGGGSNNIYLNPIRVLDNNGISASISAVASVFVTITGFTAKT